MQLPALRCSPLGLLLIILYVEEFPALAPAYSPGYTSGSWVGLTFNWRWNGSSYEYYDQQATAQRKVMDDVKNLQPQFRKDFAASGRDIHELPIVEVNPQVFGAASVTEAVEKSSLVITGRVISQRIDDDGVLSQIKVIEVLIGEIGSSEILVRQPGGPFLNGNEAVLIQWSSDPLFWNDREYAMFLSPCVNPPRADALCMNASPAQLEIRAGYLHSTVADTWTNSLEGRSLLDLRSAVDVAASDSIR